MNGVVVLKGAEMLFTDGERSSISVVRVGQQGPVLTLISVVPPADGSVAPNPTLWGGVCVNGKDKRIF